MTVPRRAAWFLFLAGAVFAFLAILKDGGAAPGFPRWFLDAAVCLIALGAAAWSLPYWTATGTTAPPP
jgi:hypothetical protein